MPPLRVRTSILCTIRRMAAAHHNNTGRILCVDINLYTSSEATHIGKDFSSDFSL